MAYLRRFKRERNDITADQSGSGSPSRPLSGTPGSHFPGAHRFSINNFPTMKENHREDRIHHMMELLLKYVMADAMFDDSSRADLPRRHLDIHEAIVKWLLAWFNDPSRSESLFLLTGAAGVGKSTIMQSFTKLASHPVISVFCSRPTGCNDLNRIFTTIGYQLATHIEPYRNHIVDRIAADPLILKENMETQFQVFIIEPFVVGKVGAGRPPLAILLDGLDEVEGRDAQRHIIRLIGTFMQEYPDVPLAWIVASRPEPHIIRAFEEKPMQGRFKSSTIPFKELGPRQHQETILSLILASLNSRNQ